MENGLKKIKTLETSLNSYDAKELFGDNSKAIITLDEEPYFLNLTKQNKLILTK